ncbi:inositol monophosphatase family protein [Sutterella sp.]|uniref:inositol monophosphatase family protein n=1 Tax=Sutterella sp. TaxID=1981025 RepID=UPI0025DDD1BC|nr:inositol monophosphatase family protein [uncultured Sutterella sp.]
MPTPTASLKAFVATATKAARLAAREIIRASENRDTLEVTDKAVNDFVTSADKAAEAAVIRELQEAYPRHAILSEEAGRVGDPKSDYLWIIDPIDGTTNFMHGLPQFCVSIALTYRGEPIAAVIYDVAKNELFSAAKGQGAMLDNRRIRVSDNDEMRKALIGTGFPFRPGCDIEGYLKGFKRVCERTAGIRRPGSAALDLAWVACGRYDGFWEFHLKPWDICAGGLIVLEAGGLITDLEGGEKWLETGNVCAGSPKIFAQLLPLVGEVKAEPKAEEAPAAQKTEESEKSAPKAPKKARRTLSTKKAE